MYYTTNVLSTANIPRFEPKSRRLCNNLLTLRAWLLLFFPFIIIIFTALFIRYFFQGEFVEDGTETHFSLGPFPAFIKTVSSGNRREGLIHSLIVNERVIPEATE